MLLCLKAQPLQPLPNNLLFASINQGAFGRYSFSVLKIIARFLGRWCTSVIVGSQLVACASNSSPLADVLSAVISERFTSNDGALDRVALNPKYRYLRVDIEGRPSALLVLGYVDPDPHGDIEVWYSSGHEVVKTQHGRIVGTSGLEYDWRSVRFSPPPPAWATLASQGEKYTRLRDEMPGHRFALRDELVLESWTSATLPLRLPRTITAAQAQNYRWFRETSTSANALPPAWYAVGRQQGRVTVVYSVQCLAVDFCLKLQPWPVEKDAS